MTHRIKFVSMLMVISVLLTLVLVGCGGGETEPTSVPTLILTKGGKEIHRIVGARPKRDLLAQLQPHLG